MLPRAVPLHPRFVTLITSAVAAVTGVGLGNARGLLGWEGRKMLGTCWENLLPRALSGNANSCSGI